MEAGKYCGQHAPRRPFFQKVSDALLTPLASRIAWAFQLKQEPFPGIISLEVTSICNLKCPMCPRTFSDRKFSHMPMDMYRRLIDEIAVHDAAGEVEQVALQGYGEIFLHPDWFEIVEYASGKIKNAFIRLDSNGTMMKDGVIAKLFESRLKVLTVSVDGVDQESYAATRTGGKYDDLLNNLRHFIELRRRRPDEGPELYLQIIESEYTRPYLEEFKRFWAKETEGAARVRVSVIPFHDFAGQIQDERFAARPKPVHFFNLPCYRLTYEVEIFSDGVTSVCCLDSERQLAIGNAGTKGIGEVWKGPEAQRLRRGMRSGNYRGLELCRTCPLSQKFYRDVAAPARLMSSLAGRMRRFMKRRFF